jgi:hypothetical protein
MWSILHLLGEDVRWVELAGDVAEGDVTGPEGVADCNFP